jgi:hypothetical protein
MDIKMERGNKNGRLKEILITNKKGHAEGI